MTNEERIARRKQRYIDAAWRRRARGECQNCGRKREPGNNGWTCRREACRERINERKRIYQARPDVRAKRYAYMRVWRKEQRALKARLKAAGIVMPKGTPVPVLRRMVQEVARTPVDEHSPTGA